MNAGVLTSDQVGRIEPTGRPPEGVSDLKTDERQNERQLDILLMWRGRFGLFKKSGHRRNVSTPWQLLSVPQKGSGSALDEGFLQCIQLLHSGTGLTVRDILTIQPGPTVELSHGSESTVHVLYVVETNHRRLALGPEYSVYRWVKPPRIGRFDGGADWLTPILEVVAPRPSKPIHPGETSEGESPMIRNGVLLDNRESSSWTSRAAVSVATTVFDDPPELVRVLAEV